VRMCCLLKVLGSTCPLAVGAVQTHPSRGFSARLHSVYLDLAHLDEPRDMLEREQEARHQQRTACDGTNRAATDGSVLALKGNRERKADGHRLPFGLGRRRLPVPRSLFYFFEEVLIRVSHLVDIHISMRLDDNDHSEGIR